MGSPKKVKVFVVTSGCYSDYSIRGIFSSKPNAEKYKLNCGAASDCYWTDLNDIYEYDLDSGLREKTFHYWRCALALDNGEVLEKVSEATKWGIPHGETYIAEGRGIVRAKSHKSAAHCLKLAAEARQKWLRAKMVS